MNAQISTPVPVQPKSPIQETASLLAGVNVLLEGATGTGKTYSIGTLVDSGVETSYLGLENGLETILGYYTDRGLSIPPNLHWHAMQIAIPGGFAAMSQAAQQIGSMTQDSLHKMQDF